MLNKYEKEIIKSYRGINKILENKPLLKRVMVTAQLCKISGFLNCYIKNNICKQEN